MVILCNGWTTRGVHFSTLLAIDNYSSSTCPFIALTAGPAAGGSYRARKPSQMQTLEQHRSGSHKLL